MEYHASKRDVYGIPIISLSIPMDLHDKGEEEGARIRIRKEERKTLRAMTEYLRQLHYIADFLENWMFSNALLAKAKRFATRTDQDVKDLSRTVDGEIECLETHRKDILDRVKKLLDLQGSLAGYLIGPHTDYVPDVQPPLNPFSTPRWLLRAFHGKSFCQYREIGILGSGYMSSNPGLSFDDLIKTQGLSETSLRNHCGGSKRTPLISMADDPAWLLHFVRSLSFPETTRIAFINVKKLELMGVLHGQARFWAMKVGAESYSAKNQYGVHYLGPTHWLAYGWIPSQCIDDVWSLNDFRQVCSESGIPEGNISLLGLAPEPNWQSQDCSSNSRISTEEIIAKSSNDLSNRFKESLKLQ